MCIKVSGKLTVYFEPPFWVGIFEEISDGKIATCKIVFGEEPKDYEVYDFILENFSDLKFSRPVPVEVKTFNKKVNPKRLQRQVKKQTLEVGIGTKAQQVIKAEHEANKLVRKRISKDEKERLQREKYQKKQQKKKLKKRGH